MQNPLSAFVAIYNGVLKALNLDSFGLLQSTRGGTSTALNLTAAAVVKAKPGRVARLVIVAGGTASDGTFTLNDCATTGAASAANTIASIAAGATAGTVIDLDWPCTTGIVLSAVPSAGSPIIAISYT
jgi:hypothetical protein